MSTAGTVVILAAGQGTRMRSPLPKVLHRVCGRTLLGWVLEQARSLDPTSIQVVVGHGADQVRAVVEAEEADPRIAFVPQLEQLGTGHAVLQCREALRDAASPVVVLYGDMPCLAPATLERLCAQLGQARAAALTAFPAKTRGFGRILRADDGRLVGIVEEKDADEAQRAIREVNVGVYAFGAADLVELLPGLGNQNAQGEYYLTDLIELLVGRGDTVAGVPIEAEGSAGEEEGIGVNSLEHLTEARRVLQARIHGAHLAQGVQIEDPSTTIVDHGVELVPGCRILPFSILRSGVRVLDPVEIGPHANLASGTVVKEDARA